MSLRPRANSAARSSLRMVSQHGDIVDAKTKQNGVRCGEGQVSGNDGGGHEGEE